MTLLCIVQSIFNQLNIMVPNVDMIGLCQSVTMLLEIQVMRHKCHFQAHSHCGTWLIDFDLYMYINHKVFITMLLNGFPSNT